MNLNLIVPIAADSSEYEHSMPYVFNFSDDGVTMCIKAVQGLDLTLFNGIYFVILKKHDERYNLSELLNMQFRNQGLTSAKVVMLDEPTKSEPETIYKCICQEHISGGIFIKDADGYFSCDFTTTNGVVVYPLDKLYMVNPRNKSYVEVDDQFYVINTIENKIISRFFNAGGYLFDNAEIFCSYFEKLSGYEKLYMSHIVYAMLLDNISFRPFEANDYVDWGNRNLFNTYKYSQQV